MSAEAGHCYGSRLPYSKPVLKKYGAVAAVTNANDMKGAKDGGPKAART